MVKTKQNHSVENGKQQQRNTNADRKREFQRVIEKIPSIPKRDEAGISSNKYQPSAERDQVLEINAAWGRNRDDILRVRSNYCSTGSKFQHLPRSVRYVQLGTASKVQSNEERDLEETVKREAGGTEMFV